MLPDQLFFVVSRRDVEAGDLSEIIGSLNHLISTVEIARKYRERVDIFLRDLPVGRNWLVVLDPVYQMPEVGIEGLFPEDVELPPRISFKGLSR